MDDAFDTLKNQRVSAGKCKRLALPRSIHLPAMPDGGYVYLGRLRLSLFSSPSRHRSRRMRALLPGIFTSRSRFLVMNAEHLDAVLVTRASVSQGQPFVSFAVRFRPAYPVNSVSFTSGGTPTPYTIHHNVRQQYLSQFPKPKRLI